MVLVIRDAMLVFVVSLVQGTVVIINAGFCCGCLFAKETCRAAAALR